MDFQLTFAESALVDLEEILTYSWTNFPDTAERFGAALLDHVELLKRFPLMGTPVLNRPGVRRLVHTPILVYYSVDQKRKMVEVIHFRRWSMTDHNL